MTCSVNSLDPPVKLTPLSASTGWMLPGLTSSGTAPPDCSPQAATRVVQVAVASRATATRLLLRMSAQSLRSEELLGKRTQPVDQQRQRHGEHAADHQRDNVVELVSGIDEHTQTTGTDQEAQRCRAHSQHQRGAQAGKDVGHSQGELD